MMSLATLVYSSLVGYLLKDNIAEATADKNDLVTLLCHFPISERNFYLDL